MRGQLLAVVNHQGPNKLPRRFASHLGDATCPDRAGGSVHQQSGHAFGFDLLLRVVCMGERGSM
jgi:hypothetical protein